MINVVSYVGRSCPTHEGYFQFVSKISNVHLEDRVIIVIDTAIRHYSITQSTATTVIDPSHLTNHQVQV